MRQRASVKVNGIVQGVGFRPFLSRQMKACSLSGWVRNSSGGVELEIEGESTDIDRFLDELREKAPALSLIDTVDVEYMDELAGYKTFEIIKSAVREERNTLISPDVCVCGDCLAEMYDPRNRRYRFPFINCTNCGPRFTIIKDVPYDRHKTTMGSFPMCAPCDREYHDIENRRYHAEPTCCPDCGPRLWLAGEDGHETEGYAPELAAALLADGAILAVKGLGGFHLACRFDDPALPAELRRRKQRDEKPFAVMCASTEAASRFAFVSEDERRLLEGHTRPIVLLRKKPGAQLDSVSENNYIGVMLPYTPVHFLLLDELAKLGTDSLIMTSANLSDMPIIYKNEEAVQKLRGIADAFLLNDRDIETRCDDSLLRAFEGRPYFLRRSRGYVPYPLIMKGLRDGGPMVLACGAEQKASFALCKGRYVFPSQHIGDLKNIETFSNYALQISHFRRLFDIDPQIAVCDLHPDYLSTQYAEESGLPLLRVQHHWAHMAACMADNSLDGRVMGIIWDGTGLGTDGTVWGAEFLTGGYDGFERRGSILQIKLPGGDRCTDELWRTGISMLSEAGLDPAGYFDAEQVRAAEAALRLGVNAPRASSMGRLFDGVSAILGIKREASYEGQGAVLLEAAAAEDCGRLYPVRLTEKAQDGGRPLCVFDWRPMLRELCEDLRGGVPVPEIAAGFMNTMVAMAAAVTLRICAQDGTNRVVLSGGSFQNVYMLERLTKALRGLGFEVYTHSRVSCSDEGLSLGQLMIGERHVSGSTSEDN